jgi:two-component system chemotaxis response regulator CheB
VTGTGILAPPGARPPIRVMVVDDSFPYRMFLRELVEAQPDMQVVGESGNGALATQRVRELAPDVVLMDVTMPGMDGIEAARRIAASGSATRVIVISAFQDPVAMKEALKAGVAFSHRKEKQPNAAWNRSLLVSIRRAAGVASPDDNGKGMCRIGGRERVRAVLIGASTGGPQAVATVLSGIPEETEVPILIVVHLAEHFGETLSDWMAKATRRNVRLAEDGVPLGPGQILLAPSGAHLTVGEGRVVLSQAPPRHSVRPSVDVLFESAAERFGAEAVGVLLTGMGRDGAEGLLAMRQAGALTLAQDQATSAVFGMPAEAIRLQAAEKVLPLDGIAVAIRRELAAAGRL